MIFLHIGRHKTGTSSIQHYFKENYEFFVKRNLNYITDENNKAFHYVPNILREENYSKELMMDVNKQIRYETKNINKNFLYSSEAFQNCSPSKINQIFQNTGHELVVIAYFREPISYYISSYKQRVHNVYLIEDFSTYAKKHQSLTKYIEFYKKWEKSFSNIIVKNFDRSIFKNNNLIHDFISIVIPKVKYDDLPSNQPNKNKSLNDFDLLFKLILNNLFIEKKLTLIKRGKLYENLPDMFSRDLSNSVKRFYLNQRNLHQITKNSKQAFSFNMIESDCYFKKDLFEPNKNLIIKDNCIDKILYKIDSLHEMRCIKKNNEIKKSNIRSLISKYI